MSRDGAADLDTTDPLRCRFKPLDRGSVAQSRQSVPDQDGDDVRLADLRGQTIVLYFYPKADTPG